MIAALERHASYSDALLFECGSAGSRSGRESAAVGSVPTRSNANAR